MKSSGIRLLVTLLIRVNSEKQRLLTCGLSEHHRSTYKSTLLEDALEVHEVEE